jgi:sugar phosphate isomerase/epimerase
VQRTARDLTGDDLVLGHFTLGRSYPLPQRLAAARDAGVAGIGLFVAELDGPDGFTVDDLERGLVEHQLLLVDVDLVNLAPRDPTMRERTERFVQRAVDLASRLPYRYLQTIAPTREPGAATDEAVVDALGQVADALAPYGVEVGLEYTGFTTVADAAHALRVVRATGRRNVGVCVDVWHQRRAGDPVPISVLPPESIACVQLNDGPRLPELADYKTDCVRNRWAPGTGDMEVAALVQELVAMGVDVPWTVEVCRGDDELTDGRGYQHALRSVAATRSVLDSVPRRRT